MARFRFGVPSFSECSANNRELRISPAGTIAIWLTLCLVAFVGTAWPQDPAAGILPFSTQAVGIYESVDLATSNINVTISVRNKQGKIPFSYNLVGNSHFYIYSCGGGCVPPQPAVWEGGFGLGGQPSVGATVGYTTADKQVTCANLEVDALELTNFHITDSTGAIHPLTIGPVLIDTPEPCYGGGSGEIVLGTTSDGSFYTLAEFPYTYQSDGYTFNAATFTIYDKSGNAYAPGYNPLSVNNPGGTIIQDPDGATISYTNTTQSGVPVYTYTDTLDEQATTSFQGTQIKVQYTDAANNTQTFQANGSPYTVQTNFGCPNVTDVAPTSGNGMSSITLPTGTISFTYEVTPGDTHNPHYVTGRLASITYPTGGSVSYTYSGGNNNTGINCTTAVVPTLTKTVNDGNNHLSTWTYVNSDNVQGSYTVTVTDPASNVTVYTFSDPHTSSTGYQTEAQYYQGPATGTPLKTVITCYGNQNSTQAACLASGVYGPIPTQVYTYLGTSAPSLVSTTYDTYGNITQVANYDYGAAYPPSSSTTLLSTTTTVYDNPSTLGGSYPCGTLLNENIHDRPCSITTTNSSGATVSQTSYTYNSTGHAITTSRWVNSSKSLNSSATYNATNGVLTSVTDVNGATTEYTNGPAFGACNGIFPVETTYPQIGSVQLTTSEAWDCNGAVVTSTTDPSGVVTQTNYLVGSTADPFYRPLSTVDAEGNTTSLNYWTPTTFESTMNFNGSTSTTDTRATTDGLGRQTWVLKKSSRLAG
jgi:hypothetical protein